MIDNSLRQYIFKDQPAKPIHHSRKHPDPVSIAQQQQKDEGLWMNKSDLQEKHKKGYFWPEIEKLPKLEGSTVLEHFDKLAGKYVEVEDALIRDFFRNKIENIEMPREIVKVPGWSRYRLDGVFDASFLQNPDNSENGKIKFEPLPDEKILVFDTEWMYNDSEQPIMAAALGKSHLYVWANPFLIKSNFQKSAYKKSISPNKLKLNPAAQIPLSDKTRVCIAHWTCCDRSKVRDEYDYVDKVNRKWLCTLSMHQSICGMSAEQRMMSQTKPYMLKDRWANFTEWNKLSTCSEYWLKEELDKSDREYFSGSFDNLSEVSPENGDLKEIEDNWDMLVLLHKRCHNHRKTRTKNLSNLPQQSGKTRRNFTRPIRATLQPNSRVLRQF
jgi:hypothetical protein